MEIITNLKMVAPCRFGVEALVADELKMMGAQNIKSEDGRVFFEGGADILARANLRSRISERIMLVIGRFKAFSFDELFEGIKALPWEDYIGKDDKFPVKGASIDSKLFSMSDCQSIIKKAVVERLKKSTNISWFSETGALYQIQYFIHKDVVTAMIDASGEGLHKRGYRADANEAPMKETLAAAIVNLARVKRDATLIDPCCGSGTILIEGAMRALNIAPGLNRSFPSEDWSFAPKSVWDTERECAGDNVNKDVAFEAFGFDIDDRALTLTMKNAQKAGVDHLITARKRDIADFKFETEKGIVICNPPYGERISEWKESDQLCKTMGGVFVPKKDFSYYVITPSENFEDNFGRKADKRRKLYNGMIRCQLFMYFK